MSFTDKIRNQGTGRTPAHTRPAPVTAERRAAGGRSGSTSG